MRLFCWVLIWVALVTPGATGSQTTARDIHSLMAELSDVRTIRRDTVRQILYVSKKDSAAREYVVQRLPEMIKSGTDEPWLNAVELAGKLKATETIPALVQAMSRPPFPATRYYSFGMEMRLETDIVAKALSQIGDPAIPAVTSLLGAEDRKIRGRAVLILNNMGTPAARKPLRDRLPHETDPEIKDLIKRGLGS
jgi:HEAT repeat protein